jgi:DNA replication protein DnaC
MKPGADNSPLETLGMLLRTLKLPTFAASWSEVGGRAERDGWSFGKGLLELCQMEVHDRRQRRIERLLKSSELPTDKTIATIDKRRLMPKVKAQLASLCEGDFVARAENVLIFGLPGRGKTHLCCAIGHELVRRGHAVLFTPTYQLVQQLLRAKRDLTLERELTRLDAFDAVILDDIGYVQQDRDEMEVLFTFLAERYERRSVLITSNLVFSQWDRIFKDPLTTAAAIDRLVHHAIIVEMTGPSIRGQAAQERNRAKEDPTTTTSTTTTPNPEPLDTNDNYSADGEV